MRLVRSSNQKSHSNRGVILIELALVLPIFTVLFCGVVDLGLVIREHQVLQNAVREGARFSTLPRNWVNPTNPNASYADIEQRVVDYLQLEGITVNPSDITIDQSYPINVGALTLYGSEVEVTYNRSFLFPSFFFPSKWNPTSPFTQLTLTGRAVFRNLY